MHLHDSPTATGALFAGIDIGTTHLKVGFHDEAGSCVASWIGQSPRTVEDLSSAVIGALQECVRKAGKSPAVIGIAGMAETGVPLDWGHNGLTPLLWWNDPRGAEEASFIAREVGETELYAATGRWAGAKNPLAKLLWLSRAEPSVMKKMQIWAGAQDLVLLALTGDLKTHPTLAARTLAYDIRSHEYSADLLSLAEMSVHQLPTLTSSSDVASHVSAEVASATGVLKGTPVVMAGHDHAVGAWTSGMRTEGLICDSLGTAEAVMIPAERFPDPRAAIAIGITADPALFGSGTTLGAALPTSGAVFDWFLDTYANPNPTSKYKMLPGLADRVTALPTQMLVQPYLRGRVAPAPAPDLRMVIEGIGASTTASDLLAAAIEGTCLHVRWMTQEVLDLAGVTPKRIVAFGGQVRIPLWMSIKASVSTVPLDVVTTEDAVSAGAALIAAKAAGQLDEVPMLPTRNEARDPALVEAYDLVYSRFLERVAPGRVPAQLINS